MVKVRILLILLIFSTNAICQVQEDIEGFIQYECFPSFNGDMVRFIQDNTIYPDSAKICKIEGCVFVAFDIDTLGNTLNHRIKYGIRDDFNNEAIRVASLMKFKPITKKMRNATFDNYIICVKFKPPKDVHKKDK